MLNLWIYQAGLRHIYKNLKETFCNLEPPNQRFSTFLFPSTNYTFLKCDLITSFFFLISKNVHVIIIGALCYELNNSENIRIEYLYIISTKLESKIYNCYL